MNINYFRDIETNILENESLREPQKQAYYEVYEHFIRKESDKHAIVVLPTGVGKTGLMSILPYNISSGRVLIIAPQLTVKDTIVKQLDSSSSQNFLTKLGIITNPHNLPQMIEYDGENTPQSILDMANIVITNIQKLQSRNNSSLLRRLPKDYFDMIIIDEGHHSAAKTWLENLDHFSKAKVVKITATPYRSDNKPLSGELIYKYKLSQAMAKGYVKSLEKFDYIPQELRLTIDKNEDKTYSVQEILDLNLKDNDWITRTVAYSDDCKRDVVLESIALLNEKRRGTTVPHKIIAVASNIDEAIKIEQMYKDQGVEAVIVHSDLGEFEKRRAFSDIENNRVKVVVNINMMGEGYDHKYLSVAAIFRVFKNLSPYEQFIGRILRVIPDNEVVKASDNIGSVVVHKNLGLDELWEYYKRQLQESDIIKELKEFDDEIIPEDPKKIGELSEARVLDVGGAFDNGQGELRKSSYLTTELIKENQREEKERNEKIKSLQELLNISKNEAIQVIDQADSNNSVHKRPDLFYNEKRKNIDVDIRERYVPEILVAANLELDGSELKDNPIFKANNYRWIPQRIKVNGGMLATYFNHYLKTQIGAAKKDWTLEDYDQAFGLLDQQAEYVKTFLACEGED
ncbi:DEAD/DEAH box helicase [Listeria booriae]|uniref:DEAD/DEAH box helicase n=1 Tax=Listeria booriae TaxID=1552123 RepID=UPI001623BF9B|nr:DEAD/DEAH box helicase family protein [Listeria booriae]MBC1513587.1 DEAD/DEAH box helicase family protein [Listeria booriae]MBC6152540.1 DEAD/DEAH box helicase family protein [Listeria booriae]MBC6306863.1 DEAD/DEAH box helicase family protein [Listeria booriae]